MNLNISYNWLKEYVKTDLSAQEFAKRISLVGPSVDHITEIKPDFSQVVVGQIKEINNHPDADKLHVCRVNVGKKELQIVCGAANIEVGQKVPVVLVGGRVGEFEIKAAKLRGVESFGMMCSQKELDLGADHSGIFILPADSPLGQPLEKLMPLNDYILDVEVTSNRPDAMSIVGLAREASAAIGAKYLWQAPRPSLKLKATKKKLAVKVSDKKLCSRYQVIVMSNVSIAPSPLWLQQRLISAGLRPINNLADITNYILLEYGQPMHVFDYDKLRGAEINVRLAKFGEKLAALDGKEYELNSSQLVIADKQGPVAIAGVMGGEAYSSTTETVNIVFECAVFDSISVRKTSRALNLRSDSSNLYEKGIHPQNVSAAMLKAIDLAQQIAGAKIASPMIDEGGQKHKPKTIKLQLSKVSKLLGIKVSSAEAKKSLEALGFAVKRGLKESLIVTVPWWREGDVDGDHDLIEEVARMHGYGSLPTELMPTPLPVNYSSANDEFYWEDMIKDILAGFGLTEIYTYSFISEKEIINSGLDLVKHVRIANPLSSDFEYMRTTLVPGALTVIADNQGLQHAAKLFDLSKVYLKRGNNDLADEDFKLLITVYGNDADQVTADAKGVLEGLRQRLNISALEFKTDTGSESYFGAASAIYAKDQRLGTIGLVSSKTKSGFGLKKEVVLIELDFHLLVNSATTVSEYQPIAKFPAIELDLSMEITEAAKYSDVVRIAQAAGNKLIEKIEFLSLFRGEKIASGAKALAIRIVYSDANKTLELKEAQAAHEKVVDALKKEYNISIR